MFYFVTYYDGTDDLYDPDIKSEESAIFRSKRVQEFYERQSLRSSGNSGSPSRSVSSLGDYGRKHSTNFLSEFSGQNVRKRIQFNEDGSMNVSLPVITHQSSVKAKSPGYGRFSPTQVSAAVRLGRAFKDYDINADTSAAEAKNIAKYAKSKKLAESNKMSDSSSPS